MELWALAVAATPPEDPTARLGRRRELAAAAFTVGDVERAGSMLDELLADAPDGPERARILLSLAKVRFEQRSATEAVEMCDEAAAHANEDPSMRARILALATQVCDFDMERRAGYARAAWDAIRRDDDPDPASVAEILTALALVELCLGHGLREDLIRRAIEIEARRPPVIVSVRAACNLADWYVRCDRYADARPLMEADLVACRDGDEGSLCQVLVDVARLDIVTGHWSVAEDELREALEMAEGDGQPTKIVEVLALLAPLEAVTGRAALAEEHVVTADATAIDLGDPVALVLANVGAGSVAFHLGDPAVAVSRLSAADREDEREHLREPGFRPYMGDLIEARVELGQPAEALEALERLEAMARSVDRASGLAAAARCRALLTARADVDVALGWCARARAEHDRVGDPFQLGRTVLVEGRIRRRHRQKLAAREVLKEAQAIFDGLGASAWSARAQAELDRTGRRLDEPTALTGTERRVAELVASGLSNREVAGLMFISSRTVEANLTRIYRKLQVPSRAALGRRLAELESD